MYQTLDDNNVDLSVHLKYRPPVLGHRHPLGGDRRRDDHPRRGERLLRERHEPRDVPLHHDQSPLQRPADGDGHHPAARPHPPGRDPQPRRRQHAVPDQLHRLPQRHGSDGAGVRVLQLLVPGERDRRDGLADRADRVHRRSDAAEVPHQQHQLPAGVHHAGRQLDQPLAHGPESGARLERDRSPAPAAARSPWARSSRAARRSPAARSPECSRRCATARRPANNGSREQLRHERRRRDSIADPSFQSNNYSLRQVFAEAAAYCMGN